MFLTMQFKSTFLVAVVAVAFSATIVQAKEQSPWTYVCRNKFCGKVFRDNLTESEIGRDSVEICKLNCGDYGSLWPKPTGTVMLSKDVLVLDRASIAFEYTNAPGALQDWLETAERIFDGYLNKTAGIVEEGNEHGQTDLSVALPMVVAYNITSDTKHLGLKTNEGYELEIGSNNMNIWVTITAETYFGARHALETLSQLIAYEKTTNEFMIIANASITDQPVYAYRGLMVDTSRNFIPVEYLKRHIDGLSYNKLNIFHWHLTDTHSFPMEVTNQPNLTKYGAYSQDKIYTVQQMRELVDYAIVRGVKIVPEFDEPAHVGNGWIWGSEAEKDELAVCVNKDYWHEFCVEPPCGQLNPIKDKIYPILGDIFKSMFDVFNNDIFHMGGDEVDMRCYNSTKSITDYMTQNDIALDTDGFMHLWGEIFQKQAYQKLVDANKDRENLLTILWTSELTSEHYALKYLDPTKYAIQIWTEGDNAVIPFLINHNFSVIFSNVNAWYLDCGFHNWILDSGYNWCSPYKTWQQVYENSPYKIYAAAESEEAAQDAYNSGLLLGGIAPLWSESIDAPGIETRFWPRGSALAERLWSDPREEVDGATVNADTTARIVTHRRRFVKRGMIADAIHPEWCYQNEGKCTGEGMPAPPEPTTTTERNGGAGNLSISAVSLVASIALLSILKQ